MKAWQAAYPDIDGPSGAQRERQWPELVASTLVAELDGTLVGFAATQGDELAAMYVDPSHQRKGIGTRLMRAITATTLWVFEHNDQARRFYAKHGFEPDGARREHRSGATVIRLSARRTPGPASP